LTEYNSPLDTTLIRTTDASIAGCYAITAIDSFGNESEMGDALCIDNCPVYELPNIFTPGGDGTNDFFRPFPYKFIESIDLTIYNRWGVEVFRTNDPEIMWNGTFTNGEPLPSGVYYYVCSVNEIRLTGIVTRVIYDHVTILQPNAESSAPAP
jgi:gliding motility-associated-like protein